jgi:hypothetical protein
LDSGVLMLDRERSRRSGERYEVGGIVDCQRALDMGEDQSRRGKAEKKMVGESALGQLRTSGGARRVQEIEK